MEIPNNDQLTKYGVVGLCALLIYVLWNLMGNHIDHSNEAMNGVSESINQNTQVLIKLETSIDTLNDNILWKIK